MKNLVEKTPAEEAEKWLHDHTSPGAFMLDQQNPLFDIWTLADGRLERFAAGWKPESIASTLTDLSVREFAFATVHVDLEDAANFRMFLAKLTQCTEPKVKTKRRKPR